MNVSRLWLVNGLMLAGAIRKTLVVGEAGVDAIERASGGFAVAIHGSKTERWVPDANVVFAEVVRTQAQAGKTK